MTVRQADPGSQRAAVFLDRDDTLIANSAIGARMAHPGYLYQAELVELLAGAAEGCVQLARAGYALVVVTNQSAVARGWCRVKDVDRTNLRVRELVRRAGVELAGVYTSLHSPEGAIAGYACEHAWRKPGGGMITAAAADLGLDLGRSWMIGDAERDVQAAVAGGIAVERTIVVGERRDAVRVCGARARDVAEAAEIVLRSAGGQG